MKIDIEYLKREYDRLVSKYGNDAYKHISELFTKIRKGYAKYYLSTKKVQKLRKIGKTPDPEQSWRAFKGKNFEKLIFYIIERAIKSIYLELISGEALNRKDLTSGLSKVRRNLLINYGKYSILPDADLVVYNPENFDVIAIISAKITLRERIAQTAYWKLKLLDDPVTMDIKGLFVTTDEDRDLEEPLERNGKEPSRNRIIVEHDLDGTYVLSDIAESEKVKSFSKLIDDLKRFSNERKNKIRN